MVPDHSVRSPAWHDGGGGAAASALPESDPASAPLEPELELEPEPEPEPEPEREPELEPEPPAPSLPDPASAGPAPLPKFGYPAFDEHAAAMKREAHVASHVRWERGANIERSMRPSPWCRSPKQWPCPPNTAPFSTGRPSNRDVRIARSREPTRTVRCRGLAWGVARCRPWTNTVALFR